MTMMIGSICTSACRWCASKCHMQHMHSILGLGGRPTPVTSISNMANGHTQEIRCLHHSTTSASNHKYICPQEAVMQRLQHEYN